MRDREYTPVIEQDGDWVIATCPEVKGANGQGRTEAEALESLRVAIELLKEELADGAKGKAMVGTCFQGAYDYLMKLSDDGEGAGYVLVHGVVSRNCGGDRKSHAWVESRTDDCVIEVSSGKNVTLPKPVYYERYGVQQPVSYAVPSARMQNALAGHYGPWETFEGIA